MTDNLGNDITIPLGAICKELEISRKQAIDEGAKHGKVFQETFTALRKAKESHEDATSILNDAKEAMLKAQRSANVKEKEIDKVCYYSKSI